MTPGAAAGARRRGRALSLQVLRFRGPYRAPPAPLRDDQRLPAGRARRAARALRTGWQLNARAARAAGLWAATVDARALAQDGWRVARANEAADDDEHEVARGGGGGAEAAARRALLLGARVLLSSRELGGGRGEERAFGGTVIAQHAADADGDEAVWKVRFDAGHDAVDVHDVTEGTLRSGRKRFEAGLLARGARVSARWTPGRVVGKAWFPGTVARGAPPHGHVRRQVRRRRL